LICRLGDIQITRSEVPYCHFWHWEGILLNLLECFGKKDRLLSSADVLKLIWLPSCIKLLAERILTAYSLHIEGLGRHLPKVLPFLSKQFTVVLSTPACQDSGSLQSPSSTTASIMVAQYHTIGIALQSNMWTVLSKPRFVGKSNTWLNDRLTICYKNIDFALWLLFANLAQHPLSESSGSSYICQC
jgi:hypothetical protein